MARLKILILEDDRDDAFLTESLLRSNNFNAEFIHACTKAEYETALTQERPDIILSDHLMGTYTSHDALRVRNEVHPATIFILVTGAVSDEFAVETLKEGANDYVLKTKMHRLPVAIENALQKREMKEAARKATERFELAASASKDVIVDYDYVTKTMYISPAFEKYGYTAGEGLPMDAVFKHIHPEDATDFLQRYQQFIEQKENRLNCVFRLVKADGSTAYVNVSSLLVIDEQHRPKRILSVLHDITDVRHLQKTLERNELKHQRKLAETSVKAQEREREEIAKELHDNIGQLLATAKLMLETGMKHPELLDTTLAKGLDVISTAIHDTRNLSHAIMPPEMDEKLFLEKIREVANSISLGGKIKIRCSLPEPEKFRHIGREAKLAVYRIVQEQLTNIVKYSKASEGLIELKTDGYIALTIKDNGVGFDTKKQSHGLGLTNIKNRAAILNGSMDVQSAPGQGTTLTVNIPVAGQEEEFE